MVYSGPVGRDSDDGNGNGSDGASGGGGETTTAPHTSASSPPPSKHAQIHSQGQCLHEWLEWTGQACPQGFNIADFLSEFFEVFISFECCRYFDSFNYLHDFFIFLNNLKYLIRLNNSAILIPFNDVNLNLVV